MEKLGEIVNILNVAYFDLEELKLDLSQLNIKVELDEAELSKVSENNKNMAIKIMELQYKISGLSHFVGRSLILLDQIKQALGR